MAGIQLNTQLGLNFSMHEVKYQTLARGKGDFSHQVLEW